MLKRLLRISEIKNTGILESLLHYSIAPLLVLLLVSCAPKHVEVPSYERADLNETISELKKIRTIEAVLSVDYEKGDSAMSGDASMNLSEKSLDLKLYYLGFLAGEVKEENGVIIKNKPRLDKNKSAILVDGLKNSFFWWNMQDYTLQEREDSYELKNSYRKLFISKKTLLPVRQIIEINDGEKLNILYDSPVKQNAGEKESNEKSAGPSLITDDSSPSSWYNSALRIEFKNYIVRIKVKSYSVVR
ncbi:MAG: hypothetical protein A2077_02510 [Nitrospirae bacterium GWC2_46_6]|nr:MAG: hypothetical protein A2Z82_06165 [Nitrospirae bacterium GWA2_46_11]OGW22677.1 MAG: hypothetical protein A2077_02510 [Nitrospirae bacterium GWC2_46_6]OGW23526.1 MAG: hypothetical protein A2X55_04055 [Nitrospirae bacterium GWB2_47_37]HAK87498.1 hypothetical protein [Nitrospiraceae bacterium]HCL81599.1 hypothetical protein [Nitrospiraceae bacterium]